MLRRSHIFTTNLASLRRRNGSKARCYTATTVVLHRHRPPSQVRKPSLQGREGAAPPSAGQNRPSSASCSSGIQCRRGPAQARLDGTECACNARTNVHLHARTNVRRRAPGQVLSGTFGTHSPSQSTTGSPCGESSSSRVRRWLLARSTGFSILVLHMLTWCRRLSRSGCALCSVARAAVTAAERCGCRGGAVLYRSSGSSRLEHRRLFSTKPRATASCNAHA